jgi:serine/threonine protein kinase
MDGAQLSCVDWASLTFEGERLEGFTVDGRYELMRFAGSVRGSYGLPFEARDLRTGERLFVKLLSAAAAASSKASRELATAQVLGSSATSADSPQEPPQHPGARHLAQVRAVLPRAVAQCGDVRVVNVPALIFVWYCGGDGHSLLFAPPRRTTPLPERVARHVFGQLVSVRAAAAQRRRAERSLYRAVRNTEHFLAQALACLHAQQLYHRDVKLENFVFDERFDLKVRVSQQSPSCVLRRDPLTRRSHLLTRAAD